MLKLTITIKDKKEDNSKSEVILKKPDTSKASENEKNTCIMIYNSVAKALQNLQEKLQENK